MYLSEELATKRHQERLDDARGARRAQHATELRRLGRVQRRAERRLVVAWRRAEEAREAMELAL
jgi:hypothetical protein